MNNYSHICNIDKNLNKKFLCVFTLLVAMFAIGSYNIDAFAQNTYEINIPTGAADPGAAYFWQVESNGNTDGQIVISQQDSVIWKNADSTLHTVTSGDPGNGVNGLFDSGLFGPGESFSFEFTNPGKFDYFCTIHPWMLGVVTVDVGTSTDAPTVPDNFSKTKNTINNSFKTFPYSDIAVIVISSNENYCKDQVNCYLPMDIVVEKDTLVIWRNFGEESVSLLSGNIVDGQNGLFQSGEIKPGESFSHRFETQLIHEYYDILHPLTASGKVTVTGKIIDKEERMTAIKGMSSDGTVAVNLEVMNPTDGKAMGIHVKFTDEQGDLINNLNYDLTAVQNEHNVLTINDNYSHAGIEEHWTDVLASGDPVNVKITLLGIGMPGLESDWTGPKGDIIMFNVVPEFGTVAMMILSVAILSIIAVTAKSRIISKLN